MWVRTAAKRDLVSISQLLGEVWHQTYDDLYGKAKVAEITSRWHNVEALDAKLTQPGSEFLVADNGQMIAGMAFASLIGERKVKLHQLYLLRGFVGKGVGHMLLSEIEESFFDVGQFILEVEEQNTAARRFYERHGYKHSATTANCGNADSGIAALIYSKIR